MKTIVQALAHLTDEQLLLKVIALAADERQATAHLIASLAEIEARDLHLAQGYSSLFTYCTQHLHLSESAAYSRIAAARAGRKWPFVLEKLADGSITLTTVTLLSAHLTALNHRALLEAATHRSKREVEQQVAALHPQPAVPTVVRKLPTLRPVADHTMPDSGVVPGLAGTADPTQSVRHATSPPNMSAVTAAPRPAVIAPLAPECYKVQVTISRQGYENLRRAQALLRHMVPSGDPSVVIERSLAVLVADLERKKLALTPRPRAEGKTRPRSRHIPAAIRREVWGRDSGRCTFIGPAGRCTETGFLEFHHVEPFADGGGTTVPNLTLRCRAHNAYEARQHFGPLLLKENAQPYSVRTESKWA